MEGFGIGAVANRAKIIRLPDGSSIELCVLAMGDFAQIKEQACDEYKRNLIKTWTKNADLLPEAMRAEAIQKAFERAEQLTVDNLPKRKAWLPAVDNQGKMVVYDGEPFVHPEAGVLIEKGGPVLEYKDIDYVTWWMSQTNEGRLYTTWLSMRRSKQHVGITYDQVCDLFMSQASSIGRVADEVGDLSRPRMGNDQPAAASAGT